MPAADLLTTPPPDASPADASAIAEAAFGIRGKAIPLPGERDRNFVIESEDGRFSLKVANPAEAVSVLDMQQRALAHIADADPTLPVPRPIPALDGNLAVEQPVGGTTTACRVLTFMEGTAIPPGPAPPALRDAMAALLARLDRALAGFEHPELDRTYMWNVANLGLIAPLVEELPDWREDLVRRWLDLFQTSAHPVLSQLPRQAIHSDLNPENVLVHPEDSEEIVGIIDFSDLIRAPRVADPAIAAAYLAMYQEDPASVIAEFAASYHARSRLDDEELAVFPYLAAGRLVQSLTIGAWRARLHPDNRRYILIHAEPVWQALVLLNALGADDVLRSIKQASGVIDEHR